MYRDEVISTDKGITTAFTKFPDSVRKIILIVYLRVIEYRPFY